MSNNDEQAEAMPSDSTGITFESAQGLSIISLSLPNLIHPQSPQSLACRSTEEVYDVGQENSLHRNPGFFRESEILVRVINEDSSEQRAHLNHDSVSNNLESQQTVVQDTVVQSTSQQPRNISRNFSLQNSIHRNLTMKANRCYRAVCGETNSNMTVAISPPPLVSSFIFHGPPSPSGAPPSYSTVMRHHQNTRPICLQPSPTFIAPIPPPTYAEVQGFQLERPVIVTSVDHMIWGPEPLTVICPRCSHVVVTSIESHRSNLTHFSALALCLCGCWPCCLLPYCMESCKNVYHRCPTCNQYLGMYRPW